MATITTQQIQALIAFTISNNKPAVINAMNATGNYVSSNITDDDLFTAVNNVFIQKGLGNIKVIFSKIPIITSKLTVAQQTNIANYYKSTTVKSNPNLRCGFTHPLDCLQSVVDLVAGSSQTVSTPSSTNTVPVLSPTTLAYIAGIAMIIIIILLIVFRKTLSVVKFPILAIVIIVVIVGLYGTFAKKTVTTAGSTDTTTHGSITKDLLALIGL